MHLSFILFSVALALHLILLVFATPSLPNGIGQIIKNLSGEAQESLADYAERLISFDPEQHSVDAPEETDESLTNNGNPINAARKSIDSIPSLGETVPLSTATEGGSSHISSHTHGDSEAAASPETNTMPVTREVEGMDNIPHEYAAYPIAKFFGQKVHHVFDR